MFLSFSQSSLTRRVFHQSFNFSFLCKLSAEEDLNQGHGIVSNNNMLVKQNGGENLKCVLWVANDFFSYSILIIFLMYHHSY